MPITRPGALADLVDHLRALYAEERRRHPQDLDRLAAIERAGKAVRDVEADAEAAPDDTPDTGQVRLRLRSALSAVLRIHSEWEREGDELAALVERVRPPGVPHEPEGTAWERQRNRGGG